MPSTRPATGCFMPSTRRPEGNLAPPTPRAGCVPQARHAGGAGMEARHAARGAAALPVAVDRGGLPDSAEAGPPRAACTEPTPGVRGAVSPTGRRAQTGQHNRDRLGLSELWAVTRVRGAGRLYRPSGVRGAISPTGRRAQTGQHNRDRLGLSELWAVTRARGHNQTLTPRLRPLPALPGRTGAGPAPGAMGVHDRFVR